MTCAESHDLMLDAAPAELRGEGDSDLARHIAGCDECRRAGAALLAATTRLDSALDALRAKPRRRRAGRGMMAGIAVAAATLVLMITTRDGGGPVRGTGAETGSARRAPDVVASGSNVAVFKTGNPTITVVWFF